MISTAGAVVVNLGANPFWNHFYVQAQGLQHCGEYETKTQLSEVLEEVKAARRPRSANTGRPSARMAMPDLGSQEVERRKKSVERRAYGPTDRTTSRSNQVRS